VKKYNIEPIGIIQSEIKNREDAPIFSTDGAPNAYLKLSPKYISGLDRMKAGDNIIVITWLHLADRHVLRVHPQRDSSRPIAGVFSTRSPDRPNPLGLHRVRVLAINDEILFIGPIEVVDGTPVVDIKPVVEQSKDF
jgi:tRNA-Thr(GGU) m(6)t(6)A37 methyltransferase TsaA